MMNYQRIVRRRTSWTMSSRVVDVILISVDNVARISKSYVHSLLILKRGRVKKA